MNDGADRTNTAYRYRYNNCPLSRYRTRVSDKKFGIQVRTTRASAVRTTYVGISMLLARDRIGPIPDAAQFIDDIVRSRGLRILPLTPAIAVMSQADLFAHGDPADRLIAATAIVHNATLITADKQLRKIRGLRALW